MNFNKNNNKITLESTTTISIVKPPAAEYCFQSRMILTLIFHIVLKGLRSDTLLKEAISFLGKMV